MSRPAYFKFRLYVAGNAPNSTVAVANLGAFCRSYLANRHEIEIVDVLREPMRALEDGILMTPILVKLAPGPILKVVGTLSQPEILRQALGLEPLAA